MSISSSDNPSEKYSWSFFSLMSTNGRTATDFPGIAGAAVTGTGADATGAVAGVAAARWLDSHRRSAANPTRAKLTTDAPTSAIRLGHRVDTAGAGACTGGTPVGVMVEACTATCTAATSLGSARAGSPELASSHCEVLRKYSKPAGNGALSMRSDMTACRFEAARSTSLST